MRAFWISCRGVFACRYSQKVKDSLLVRCGGGEPVVFGIKLWNAESVAAQGG